jgi:CHAT domain-containing protein
MAQVRLRNLTGEEFKLNYRDDLEQHLMAYAKANRADRKELRERFESGEIDEDTRDRDEARLTKAYNDALGIIDALDDYCQTDKPFTDPYYWAAFTCQGLA